MKSFEDDIKFRQFLKNTNLNSPGKDFTTGVMSRIFQEESVLRKVKSEPVLGKGFWIILFLFGLLLMAVIAFSGSEIASDSLSGVLPEINTGSWMTNYRLFFDKLNSLPASIAGICLAGSMLVFLERFLESKKIVIS
jgi:hypothetical protein